MIDLNTRIKISSGTKWESIVGYSRVVRAGNIVHVSGTTATDPQGNIVGIGEARTQTVQALKNVQKALESVGAKLEDVVGTRIYVTDIKRWEEVGRAHGAFFRDIQPTTSMIEVKGLVNPDMLVEIEAEAILD